MGSIIKVNEYKDFNNTAIMTSDGAGNLSTQKINQPYFYGEKAAILDLSRGVVTQVTGFTSNEVDTNTAFDGTTFTVPSGQAGKYVVTVSMTINFDDEGNDGENFIVYLYKNGSSVKQAIAGTNASADRNIARETVTIYSIVDLAVSDALTYYAYGVDANGGGGGTIEATNSSVSGFKVGA